MKKLFLVLAMVASACAWAESEVVDGVTWYYGTQQRWDSAEQKYVTYAYVTSGADKYTGDLVVPSTLGGYKVKEIGYAAFYECSSLTSVTIPEGVTSIGRYSFCGCSSLELVTMPEGLASIDWYAFSCCGSLASVTIPEGVTSIGREAFYKCSSLKSVTMSGGVTSIGIGVFYQCSSLTSVTIPKGVTCIAASAFRDCSLLESVTIPEGVTSIDSYAFEGCSSLASVTIPSSVTSIEYDVFSGCNSLASVTILEGVTSIGSGMFRDCSSLKSVTIPSSVTSIGNNAFQSCSSLTDVTFSGVPPSGVENSGLLSNRIIVYPSKRNISYPREHGAAWVAVINDIGTFKGYNRQQPEVTVVSSKIRASDPTILDVVYKVTSSQPTVKVRALAFEDGVRSFANVVRPETFVGDTNGVATAGNVGDAIMPNVEHTLSWRVASDWSNRLAKVTFEVLASEGGLLPLEVRTIPASDQYGKMDVTWNAISESQWFDALMWLYADKNKKVTITDGVYFYDGKIVANGTTMYYNKSAGSYYSRTYDSTAKQYVYVYYKNVQEVVYGEMGYTLLTGDVLNYVNDETRLGLSPSGYRQYGYRIVGE